MSRESVGLESVLSYSDGTKFSRASDVPPAPAFQSAAYGQPAPTQPFPATYNFESIYGFGDGAVYRDDERDADRDGLSNFLEAARGPGYASYWAGYWKAPERQIDPWKKTAYCGQRPGIFEERPFADLNLADPDVDGDGLLDGEDDQDNDDINNITELYEVVSDLDNNGDGQFNPPWCAKDPGAIPSIDIAGTDYAVNPFNPCAPNPSSRSCPPYIPFD
jgi:hypothetical protein